ncbi:MAG: tandem-95 repeat protein [Bacteroidetes bacterium]|nr:tandem-95 repeat protein [Bacteroidota bacterium]
MTITVQPDPDRDPIAIDDRYTARQGETLTVAAPGLLKNDYDPDGDDMQAVSYSQPAEGSASLNTAGEISYTPDEGFTGTDSFTYNIRDANGGSTSTGTVFIDVKPPSNRPPITVDDAYTVVEGQTLDVSAPGVLKNDDDPDDDDVIASGYFSPSDGSLSLNTAGEFTYTPDPGFTGTDSFTYRNRDPNSATSTSSARVEVTVIPASQTQPVAGDDYYRVKMDSTLSVPAPGLLANDLAPGSSSRIVSGFSSPSNGSVSVVTNGEIEYTTIDVYNPNRPPEAHDDTYVAIGGQETTLAAPGVLANDLRPGRRRPRGDVLLPTVQRLRLA